MNKKDLKSTIVQFEKKLPYKMYDYDFERGFYRVDETVTVNWDLFFSVMVTSIQSGVNGSCSYLWDNKFEIIAFSVSSFLLIETAHKNKKVILALLAKVHSLQSLLAECHFTLGPMEIIQEELEIGIIDVLAKLHLSHQKDIDLLKSEFELAIKVCKNQNKNKSLQNLVHGQRQHIANLSKLVQKHQKTLKRINGTK
jgi:hypothetical protein